jgi:hypothetical protein
MWCEEEDRRVVEKGLSVLICQRLETADRRSLEQEKWRDQLNFDHTHLIQTSNRYHAYCVQHACEDASLVRRLADRTSIGNTASLISSHDAFIIIVL